MGYTVSQQASGMQTPGVLLGGIPAHKPTSRLYNLLPVIYRQRDLEPEQGQALLALMTVLEGQYDWLEADITRLYHNWFIETCDNQVIPYIADLIGMEGLDSRENVPDYWRAWVANTMGYRRRKGTLATMARAGASATGWKTYAVDFNKQLARTQSVRHVCLGQGELIDVRNMSSLELMDSPANVLAHTIDVRNTSASGQLLAGRYNLKNVGVFVCRLQTYPVMLMPPNMVSAGAYTFHPFGVDMPLFHHPETQPSDTDAPSYRQMPLPLRRSKLAGDHALLNASLQIFTRNTKDDPLCAVPARHVAMADLSAWQYDEEQGDDSWVQVDPEYGRFMLSPTKFPEMPVEVKTNYSYGFSANMAGGPYDRSRSLYPLGADGVVDVLEDVWVALVSRTILQEDPIKGHFNTLESALAFWQAAKRNGVIRIMDNAAYRLSEDPLAVTAPFLLDGNWLVIEAVNGCSPSLMGNIAFSGQGIGTTVTLNGLWIQGSVRVTGAMTLNAKHCTLLPPTADGCAITSSGQGSSNLQVAIESSIVGPIRLPERMIGLCVKHSVVDGLSGDAVSGLQPGDVGPAVLFHQSTVFGSVHVLLLPQALETIFTQSVYVTRYHEGYLCFCYVPSGSTTPRRYHCQPDFAQTHCTQSLEIQDLALTLVPSFTSRRYGQPGYAQLSLRCPDAIKTGSENGSEMGVFKHLDQSQREATLEHLLDEYLPMGVSGGITYVT